MTTITPKPLSKKENNEIIITYREISKKKIRTSRPLTRKGCKEVPRPCPYVSCKFNTYLDILPNGSIKLNTEKEPWEVDADTSCVLDITEKYEKGMSNEQIGKVLSVSRETVRLLIMDALSSAKETVLNHNDEFSSIEENNRIKSVVREMKAIDYGTISKIIYKYPKISYEELIESLILSKRFNRKYLEIISYYGLLPIKHIADITGDRQEEVRSILRRLGFPTHDVYIRPGEYTSNEIRKDFSLSKEALNSWIKRGLGNRPLNEITYISIGNIIDYLSRYHRTFYLLKYSDVIKTKYRLDIVEKHHRSNYA